MKALWILALAPSLAFAAPKFDHVITVVLENSNYSEAAQQPFLTQLASEGARLDNFVAETHPSQPNYIALTSGSVNGVLSDGAVNLNVPHVGDLLEAKHLTWKVYAEDFPGHCFTGSSRDKYARKHVPFISFLDVQRNPARCANIVNADQFDADVRGGHLPNYALYIPNLNDDGHDTNVAYADRWMKKKFGGWLTNPQFTKGLLFIVTFDESEGIFDSNHILTILFGPSVKPGSTSTADLNHYSLLKLIEDEWSLGNLGRGDANATPIQGIWK